VTDRQARIAYNETLFRQLNERVAELLTEIGDESEQFEIVCECGNADCTAKIRVGRELYERVRQHSAQFFVAVGHVAQDVERVVETGNNFEIVEKHPEEALIARATDPRA
jgi:hypothetical protein